MSTGVRQNAAVGLVYPAREEVYRHNSWRSFTQIGAAVVNQSISLLSSSGGWTYNVGYRIFTRFVDAVSIDVSVTSFKSKTVV